MLARILLFSLFTGCGGYGQVPGQDTATKLVWETAYGQESEAPQVEWVRQYRLDCAKVSDQATGFRLPKSFDDVPASGDCVAGAYYPDYDTTQIALPDGYPLSKTAFAHELLHAAMERMNRYDPMHLEPDWGSSQGRPYHVYDEAQRLLEENGL